MARFYGIGIGPGDPELLTIKAARVLSELDVLLVPRTKSARPGVAVTIARPHLAEDLEIIEINMPMVTDTDVFDQAGEQAAEIVERLIAEDKNVGFITLGDPSVYSSYGYLVRAITQRVDVEIETIPGITSFCAAAALANRPLVEKDEILCVAPLNASDEHISAALAVSDAAVLMKVYHREQRTSELLKSAHMTDDAILVLRCGYPDAQIKPDVIDGLINNKDYLSIVLARD